MKKPVVSITIPTRNSAVFLPLCLRSIREQTYKEIEITIVDAYSSDDTVSVAKAEGVSCIIRTKGSLLEARYEGVKAAKGKYVLLLDSDQVLEKTAIKRAVDLAEKSDVASIALEEQVYQPQTFLEKLFEQDRKLINTVLDLDPFTGVILPRFYERSLLLKAFQKIPQSVLKQVGGQDHAIIYYEVWLLNKRVAQIPNAVYHREPDSYLKMWKKFYRWGSTSIAAHHPRYDELLSTKERFRTGLFQKGNITASLASVMLLLLKGIPYKMGYYFSRKLHEEK